MHPLHVHACMEANAWCEEFPEAKDLSVQSLRISLQFFHEDSFVPKEKTGKLPAGSSYSILYSLVLASCSPLFVPFPSPPATSKQPMRSSCTFSRDFTCEDESSPHSDNARDNANLSAFCLHPSRLLCREETKTVVSLNTKYTAKQRSRGLQNI